ncbi:MAG TPA: glycerophosphodiester phosphodiesterase [Terriglobales bacterium]|jgi:glycerophosphoryl diester phosphodiesterase|nr:glycerophosphodiester phosphodiesterase [Terriglobales bacterium]
MAQSNVLLLSQYPKPLLLGHRGAKDYAPENTLAAFETALQHGCEGIELDVRLSGDSQAVICHDPKYKRMEIARQRSSTLLGSGLCSLRDVLANFSARAFLDIELKVPGMEGMLATLLREFPPQHGYVITSFLPAVLSKLHALDPNMPIGLICAKRSQLQAAESLPLSAIVLHRSLADPKLIKDFHEGNTPVLVWGTNRASQMRELAAAGVDAIIADDTKLAHDTFRVRRRAAGNP